MPAQSVADFIRNPAAGGVFLLYGDEPQLIEEARAHLRAGFANANNRHRADVDSLADSGFAEKRGKGLFGENAPELYEAVGHAAPNKEGQNLLAAFFANIAAPDIGVCALFNMEGKHIKSAWFKALAAKARCVEARAQRAQAALFWLRRWAQEQNLSADDEALQLLAEQTEGNLAAAKQAIAKMAFVGGGGNAQAARAALADGARHDIFDLKSAVLAGNGKATSAILRRLLAAGVGAPLVFWALSDILGNALALREGGKARAWGSDAAALRQLARRLRAADMNRLLQLAAFADRLIKGVGSAEAHFAAARFGKTNGKASAS